MRRWLLPLLLVGNLLPMLWLAWMWLTPAGQIKGVHWQQPAPLPPALDGDIPLPETGVDTGRYLATLERPLFSPSRRMPPPLQPASSDPVVDTPPDIRVMGLYGQQSGEAVIGGMIARIDGQIRRVKVGSPVGRWTLKEVRSREVVLALDGVEHVYRLQRASNSEPEATASGDESGVRNPGSRPAALQQQIDRDRALALERLRAMNARRARAGLPPLPE